MTEAIDVYAADLSDDADTLIVVLELPTGELVQARVPMSELLARACTISEAEHAPRDAMLH